jgi:hypothetical protein
MIPVQHSRYNPTIAKANHLGQRSASAVVATLPVPKQGQSPIGYTLQVKGLQGTTGHYLVGFYLPGDINGDGTVSKTDIKTIRSLLGDNAENRNYVFDADINRDGMINRQDLAAAQKDLGASTKVSPVVSVNLDPASDPSMDRKTSFSVVHFAGQTTPGASVVFANNSNQGATTTVTSDSKGSYDIMVPLVSGSNTFTVTTQDGFGQSISGAISPVVYSPPNPSLSPRSGS